jgi:transcriptional regulator with XRE-family HTH domain
MFRRLGLALRICRELSGMSVRALAREAGVGPAQLSKYENGRELPKLASLEKIIGRLGHSPLSFFYLVNMLDNMADERVVTSAVVLSSSGLLSGAESAKFQTLFGHVLGLYGETVAGRVLSRGVAAANTFTASRDR